MSPRFLSVRIDDELARVLDRVTTLARERYAHAHIGMSVIARQALAVGLRKIEENLGRLNSQDQPRTRRRKR